MFTTFHDAFEGTTFESLDIQTCLQNEGITK